MLNRDMELLSDPYLAENDLYELIATNDGLLWISDEIKYRQRAELMLDLVTPEIENMLNEVDVEKLTDMEKVIYFAYQNNGPVKYTKSESLMAVIINGLYEENGSSQLTSVKVMLLKNLN